MKLGGRCFSGSSANHTHFLRGDRETLREEDRRGVFSLTFRDSSESSIKRRRYRFCNRNASELELQYSDDNSGVYSCVKGEIKHNILVKFRTCDNCIALDTGTVVGIIVGEVVATLLIGWAVYLLASQPQGKVFNQANKASDRQNLIQNQQNDSTYQQLSHGNSSEYSHLEPRRGGSTDHAPALARPPGWNNPCALLTEADPSPGNHRHRHRSSGP
ncbi:hypothetical protein COCON_G00186890 [Conger conger]|uniref:Uncharacterized protein n=1 Tax=Conger conger TaxID=82655 RepID=A0A9Q1D2W3_CONCO|nr:hypothetical protein COCON_G00186890 [Conger conger]